MDIGRREYYSGLINNLFQNQIAQQGRHQPSMQAIETRRIETTRPSMKLGMEMTIIYSNFAI
jgi:hypothetical protein